MSRENALMRAVRLRRPSDALYWAQRLNDEGFSGARMAKLLYKLALRDNLNVQAMRAAEDFTANPVGAGFQALVVRLASTEKLWSCEYGRKLVQIICAVQSDFSYRAFTDDELVMRCSYALDDDTRFSEVIMLVHEIMSRARQFAISPFRSFQAMIGERILTRSPLRSETDDLEIAMSVLGRIEKDTQKFTVIEETLVYLIVTWLVTGVFGQEMLPPDPGLMLEVAVRLRAMEIEPSWAERNDRRFEASWDGYANMALMVDKYDRLDPDDEGVLFLTKDGKWTPVIREEEGVLLVQSQKGPRDFYEVNLSILSCTCQDFLRRKQPCKHIEAALEYDERRLPFVVL